VLAQLVGGARELVVLGGEGREVTRELGDVTAQLHDVLFERVYWVLSAAAGGAEKREKVRPPIERERTRCMRRAERAMWMQPSFPLAAPAIPYSIHSPT